MKSGWIRFFLLSAGVILLLTGLAKVVSGLGHAKVLELPDPILGVSMAKLMLFVGAGELIIAATCFSPHIGPQLKGVIVAWMATNFAIYRTAVWGVGWSHPCHCMGSLAGALHLTDHTADRIMKGVLAYLLMGSYSVLLFQFRPRKAAANSARG